MVKINNEVVNKAQFRAYIQKLQEVARQLREEYREEKEENWEIKQQGIFPAVFVLVYVLQLKSKTFSNGLEGLS